jgi:hypothetical protein
MREELARAHAQVAVKLAVAPVGLRRIVRGNGVRKPAFQGKWRIHVEPPTMGEAQVHALLELLLEATVGGARQANAPREYDCRSEKREREFPTRFLAGADCGKWSHVVTPPEPSVCTNPNDPQTLRGPDGHEQESAPQSHNRKYPGR